MNKNELPEGVKVMNWIGERLKKIVDVILEMFEAEPWEPLHDISIKKMFILSTLFVVVFVGFKMVGVVLLYFFPVLVN